MPIKMLKVDDRVGMETLTDNFKDPSCYTVKDSTIFITEACSDVEVFKDEFIDEFIFTSTSFHLQPNLIFILKIILRNYLKKQLFQF